MCAARSTQVDVGRRRGARPARRRSAVVALLPGPADAPGAPEGRAPTSTAGAEGDVAALPRDDREPPVRRRGIRALHDAGDRRLAALDERRCSGCRCRRGRRSGCGVDPDLTSSAVQRSPLRLTSAIVPVDPHEPPFDRRGRRPLRVDGAGAGGIRGPGSSVTEPRRAPRLADGAGDPDAGARLQPAVGRGQVDLDGAVPSSTIVRRPLASSSVRLDGEDALDRDRLSVARPWPSRSTRPGRAAARRCGRLRRRGRGRCRAGVMRRRRRDRGATAGSRRGRPCAGARCPTMPVSVTTAPLRRTGGVEVRAGVGEDAQRRAVRARDRERDVVAGRLGRPAVDRAGDASRDGPPSASPAAPAPSVDRRGRVPCRRGEPAAAGRSSIWPYGSAIVPRTSTSVPRAGGRRRRAA